MLNHPDKIKLITKPLAKESIIDENKTKQTRKNKTKKVKIKPNLS